MNGQQQWKLLRDIFISFFKIGPVTFGGGYAMIPLIEREVVERRGWVKSRDIADVFAISESIPGAIAVNSAVFVGYRIAKVPGALAAMTGVVLPTFLIVIALCVLFLQVHDHPKVEAAFQGIRAATVALIVYAGIKIGKTAVLDKTTLAAVLATTAVLYFLHLNPVVIIAAGALTGIALVKIKQRLGLHVKLEHEETMKYKYKDYFIGDGI